MIWGYMYCIHLYPIVDKDDKAESPSISTFCSASSWLRPPLAGSCANSKASPGALTIIRRTASKYLGTVVRCYVRDSEFQGDAGFDINLKCLIKKSDGIG